MNVEKIDFRQYAGLITEDEVRCNCGKIHQDYVNKKFLDKLFLARERAGTPFNFSCICRCPDHNADPNVGGSATSGHISSEDHECVAADIKYSNNHQLSLMLKGLYSEFNRIGIDRKRHFVHVDLKKEPAACWTY